MKKSFTLAVFLGVFLCLSGLSTAAEWVSYSTDILDNELFYDHESISFPSKDIVRVWGKRIYSEEGKKDEIAERTRETLPTYGFSELSHTLCQYELNCNTRERITVGCSHYSNSGNVLDSFNVPKEQQKWKPIYPDSVANTLRKTVCELQPKGTKKKK